MVPGPPCSTTVAPPIRLRPDRQLSPATRGPTARSALTTTTNPVTWFEIATADPARATTFYGELFGAAFSADESGPENQIITPGGERHRGRPGRHQRRPPTTPPSSCRWPIVAATCARGRALGGKVLVPATRSPGVVFAQLLDTDGNQIGIWRPSAA